MHFEHHCDGILWGSWATVVWSPDCQETLQRGSTLEAHYFWGLMWGFLSLTQGSRDPYG